MSNFLYAIFTSQIGKVDISFEGEITEVWLTNINSHTSFNEAMTYFMNTKSKQAFVF